MLSTLYLTKELPAVYSVEGFSKLDFTHYANIKDLKSSSHGVVRRQGHYDGGCAVITLNKLTTEFEREMRECFNYDSSYSFLLKTEDTYSYFTGLSLGLYMNYPSLEMEIEIELSSGVFNKPVVNNLLSKRVRDW